MGSLDIKSDQRPEHETVSNGSELMVDSPTISDKNDLLEFMSEPTSTSDSDADEFLDYAPGDFSEDDASGSDKKLFSVASRSSSISSTDPRLEGPQDFDSDHGEKGNDASESPTIQVMERPTTGKYRIPSSVFARKKSTGTDWGMASNESLFSINIGGMSFCNLDSINWKSGELDLGFDLEPSGPDKPINSAYEDQFQNGKPLEVGRNPEWDQTGKTHESDASEKSHDKLTEISSNHQASITDVPVELNSQDNREDQGHKLLVDEHTSPLSTESESRDSFAFPILTADTNAVSETNKSEQQLETEPQPEPEQHAQPSRPKTDTPTASWTRCFGCCAFCC